MKMVRSLVRRQRVLLPVERELSAGDAIRVPSDGRAEVLGILEVFVRCCVAEDDVLALAVTVGHRQRLQGCTERDDRGTRSTGVGQLYRLYAGAVFQLTEIHTHRFSGVCR